MPVLANPRWERFAQCIVQGLADRNQNYSQREAYKRAGYATTNNNSTDAAASRLLRRVKPIIDRVAEIQQQAAKRAAVTVATIVDELDEARQLAKDEKQTSTMVAATSTKAKILGLAIDRQEIGKAGDFQTASTSEELATRMLVDAGAQAISDDMRSMAIAEIERHARALAAIASGAASSDSSTRAQSVRLTSHSKHAIPSVSV